MIRRISFSILALLLFLVSSSAISTHAESSQRLNLESTPYDLVDVVNALRASYGLPAYSISSILMSTAQSQADFMAATGTVTHSGPGGSSFTTRLLAAGYPLAGDLSLGGFRSENIIAGGEGMSAQEAVNQWTGDGPHLNTMVSQNLTEIGAGVAVVNGRVYYVIDCAHPTTSRAPQAVTPVSGAGSTVPVGEATISIVVINTPNVNGDVVHEVQAGQTLWQIAISYDVKIDDIKRLNNLSGNNIYPGNKLLVKKNAIPIPVSSTETATSEATFTATQPATVTETATQPAITSTSTRIPTSSPIQNTNTTMIVMIAIVVLAVLGGGIFTWLGSKKTG